MSFQQVAALPREGFGAARRPCGLAKDPYQDLMSEQHLPLPGSRHCNRKIERIIGGENAPLAGMFGFLVLRQLPFLWPNLLLWALAAALGLFLLSRFPNVLFVDARQSLHGRTLA
jgi:hypothetical protein